MPSSEWKEQLDTAAAAIDFQPHMMQQYHAGKIIEHPYFDPETGAEKIMQGRARLCPYYFTAPEGETSVGGSPDMVISNSGAANESVMYQFAIPAGDRLF